MAGLFEDKSVSAILQDFRKKFTDHKANKDDHPLHWGQFLDSTVQQAQVGLYGGVAACLAYTADGRAQDTLAKTARADMVTYWGRRTDATDPEPENNLRQNVRLAFLLLGISFGCKFNDATVAEVWTLLKERLLSIDDMWSAADLAGAAQHPSEYSTAMILILLALVRRVSDGSKQEFNEFDAVRLNVGKKLQTAFLGDRKKARQYKIAVLVAIMLSLQKKADGKVKSELRDICLKPIDIGQRYTHFFDYKKRDNTQSRDYLILPVNLLGALLLYGDDLPPNQYFFATRVLQALSDSLDKSPNQLFMEGERPSTLEQGLVVAALVGWIQKKNSLKWQWWPRLSWHLLKDYELNRWNALLFLLPLYTPMAIAATDEALIDAFKNQSALTWLIPVVASLQLPKWGLAGLALIAGVLAKPQDLIRAFLGKKK